jgi:hypothetical protein
VCKRERRTEKNTKTQKNNCAHCNIDIAILQYVICTEAAPACTEAAAAAAAAAALHALSSNPSVNAFIAFSFS